MAKREDKMNAKQRAYAKKQEQKGKNVVKWIFIGLIVLAVISIIWTYSLMS